eukprot:c9085_g1_i2 orf=157-405(-)
MFFQSVHARFFQAILQNIRTCPNSSTSFQIINISSVHRCPCPQNWSVMHHILQFPVTLLAKIARRTLSPLFVFYASFPAVSN